MANGTNCWYGGDVIYEQPDRQRIACQREAVRVWCDDCPAIVNARNDRWDTAPRGSARHPARLASKPVSVQPARTFNEGLGPALYVRCG